VAVALLVAAGSGERLGAGRPKAFVELAGRPMLEWALAALRAAGITDVVVAAPPEAVAGDGRVVVAGDEVALGAVAVVRGGAARSESVRAALAAAPPGDEVVVHDAARPLVTPEHFAATLAALADADCAVAAAPVIDTVKEAGPDRIVTATLDRTRLWAIQTPQAFRRAALERALAVDDDVLAQATDDAWLVERTGGTVRVVESTPANFKVTTPHDLRIAEALLADRLPPAPAP
jgi:2-C-methyl-D-erythritol 4-phosphate cytidylyltransferase